MQNVENDISIRKSIDEQLLDLERQYRIKKENNILEGQLTQILSRIPKEHKIYNNILEAIHLLRAE